MAEDGVAYGKPLTRVRDSVAIIRRLLREGTVDFDGETVRIENFDLWFTPWRADLPIYVSAVLPKMTAVCGEITDGAVLARSTVETAAKVRSWTAGGAELAGRNPASTCRSSARLRVVPAPWRCSRGRLRPAHRIDAGRECAY